jgi:hypothetical protein
VCLLSSVACHSHHPGQTKGDALTRMTGGREMEVGLLLLRWIVIGKCELSP